VPVDDASLHEIAQISGGQFFTAASQQELQQVYQTLGEQIGYETRRVDISHGWLIVGHPGGHARPRHRHSPTGRRLPLTAPRVRSAYRVLTRSATRPDGIPDSREPGRAKWGRAR